MAMVKIRAPVVTCHNGLYVPIGTVIELEESEARRLGEIHGVLDEDVTNSLEDLKQVAELNRLVAIYGGHGNG